MHYNFQSEEDFKKNTVEKYFQGELDIKTLNNILQTFNNKKIDKESGDIAYR